MRYQDEEVVRAELRQLAEDVEPSGDALPRLLAARRRRRALPVASRWGTTGWGAAAGLAVAVTAVFLVVAAPDRSQETEPVSVRPNSYLAQAEPGVIASFDVPSGHRIRELATVSDRTVGALVADGDEAYATVSRGGSRRLLRLSPDGEVTTVRDMVPGDVLAARSGRVAYPDGDAVVVLAQRAERRVPIPPGTRVADLALDREGRLAVLTVPEGSGPAASIRVAAPGVPSLVERPPLSVGGACGPLAITWSGNEIAALTPDGCGSGRMRVATLDADSGQQVGAGVPFDMDGRGDRLDLELSADRLGRFLVSTSDARQWVVDGVEARRVPPACAPSGACSQVPATFWG